MPFQNNYANLVTEKPQAHTRLIRDYDGSNKDFDFIIIGSGIRTLRLTAGASQAADKL
ncbi:MAG: hypothetical protein ACKPIF_02385 [Microcystis panniformis]